MDRYLVVWNGNAVWSGSKRSCMVYAKRRHYPVDSVVLESVFLASQHSSSEGGASDVT